MILLDIIDGIDSKISNSDSSYFSEDKIIVLKFINNYETYQNVECEFIYDHFNTKNIINKMEFEIKCKIIEFIGSGSYGKVYKIKICITNWCFKLII